MTQRQDQTREYQRHVTHVLADLGFYFTLSGSENGEPVWELHFESPDGTSIPVTLTLDAPFLRLTHVSGDLGGREQGVPPQPVTDRDIDTSSAGPWKTTLFAELLRLNGRLAVARVGLDDLPQIVVSAEVSLDELGPDVLMRAVAGVLRAVEEYRRIQTPA